MEAGKAWPLSNAFSFCPPADAYGVMVGKGVLGAEDLFSPESLFASGEQGVWYDPSDLTTMFQDRAGTTPVTADGQTVGLILDKSKGLTLGPELVTNGTFDTDTTGWTVAGSTVSVVDGKLQTVTTAGYGGVTRSVSVTVGRWYRIKADRFAGSANPSFRVGSSGPLSTEYVLSTNTAGSGTWYVLALSSTMYFSLIVESASVGASALFDNISVRELPGNHATAPTDAARPLKTSTGLSKWINYDGVDDSLNSTFPSSLGSSCTVARAIVGSSPTILTAQTIGTSYADSTDHAGLIIINRALTAQETTDVTAWLLAKGAT